MKGSANYRPRRKARVAKAEEPRLSAGFTHVFCSHVLTSPPQRSASNLGVVMGQLSGRRTNTGDRVVRRSSGLRAAVPRRAVPRRNQPGEGAGNKTDERLQKAAWLDRQALHFGCGVTWDSYQMHDITVKPDHFLHQRTTRHRPELVIKSIMLALEQIAAPTLLLYGNVPHIYTDLAHRRSI